MSCYRGEFVNATTISSGTTFAPSVDGTQYRCGCARLFPLDGKNCDQWTDSLAVLCLPIFLSLILYSAYVAYHSFKGFSILMANRILIKGKVKRFDVGEMTCLLVGVGCTFSTLMVCSFFLRSLPGGMDDPTFSKCLLLLPLTLLSHFQGMVGISMGWLDIAVAQERGASNLGRYRTFLKCFAVFAFAITIAFAAMGKSAILSAVCLMMSIMMSVAMKIGGAKLISMLSMGSGDAKSNTVCAGIRKVSEPTQPQPQPQSQPQLHFRFVISGLQDYDHFAAVDVACSGLVRSYLYEHKKNRKQECVGNPLLNHDSLLRHGVYRSTLVSFIYTCRIDDLKAKHKIETKNLSTAVSSTASSNASTSSVAPAE